jgi:lipopolysaccharide/colanic/teichoic acid biosynthesis glycosyltransferase
MLSTNQKIYLFFKRIIDIFGSALGIVILSPILIFVAILTKCTSKGPVFFRQKRLGKNKKPFTLLKFRSMRADARQVPPDQMTPEEQRKMTTKWGQFIRKTSLDELPQLFNILIGQMSFLGPRPSQDEEHEGDLVHERDSYVPGAYLIKPGLSGFSQIYLRRSHNYKEKAQWDCWYVKHFNLWLDFKIFVLSFLCLFGYEKGR